jgi:hypothetical protein
MGVTMSEVSFARDIACGPDHIRELLLDRVFLTQFVKGQHPVEYDVLVNGDESSSSTGWVVLTEGIPGIVRRLVGQTIPMHLDIGFPGTTDQDGSLSVVLEGKVKGRLQGALSLQSSSGHPAQTTLTVSGPLRINAGLISAKASDMARDHMIVPLLGELGDLLQEWCTRSPA